MKIYEINSTIDIQICIRFTKSNLLNRFSRTCLGAGEFLLKSKRILSGDLNDYKDAGFVMVGSENVSNVPTAFVYVIILSSLGSQDVIQIAFSISNKIIYIRSYGSSIWNEWRQI